MRIFIGIDLDPEVRARIARFIEGAQGFALDARWVRPESLHITLKFIGEQAPERVAAIAERLHGESVASEEFEIHISGYGFFPTAKASRVFWVGINAEPQISELAKNIDAAVAELGFPREDRPYSPHLTLARGVAGRKTGSPKWRKGDGPNSVFATLDKRLAALEKIDFGKMTAREFILYQSQLSAAGSKYTKLYSFPLQRG